MKEIYILEQDYDVLETQERLTFNIGEGLVDPTLRLANGEISQQTVDDLTERLQIGEFYDDISADSIPAACMDCRVRVDGQQVLRANAAGGSLTTVIADALTTNSYRHEAEKAPAHAKRVYEELKKEGHNIGVHGADSAEGDDCGCGACDKLDSSEPSRPSILDYLVRRGTDIRTAAEALGATVSDEQFNQIITNATKLREEGYVTSGSELMQACIDVAGEDSAEILTGTLGSAVVVSINNVNGTTLNRQKLEAEFGSSYRVFNVDAWSLANGAEATSITPEEAADKEVAALFYNLATGGVIAGPGMHVVIR